MNESTQNKISKLYQILSGKIQNKRADYPLFEWDTLLDFLLSFYDEFCDPARSSREKAIGMFNKLYSENVKELKNLRISKNDFDIVKTIGKGHFGEVIVVKEKNTSNVYAMKVLKKSATLSQDNMAFFFEERDIMAFANSEWVTSLHYAFQDYDNLYLVMEFLPGGDLLALLNRYEDCVVDEETCKFYLSEIIIAINCVHKIGYVHRDIKPENILLDLTGHIKLADFGSAARLVNGKQVFGKMPVGTPEYIAPEVLTSMDSGGGRYGVGCDFWSIGVVAYEMLFGCLPFESDSVLQLYNQIMHFKENLEFPDDTEIKPDTKDLICGLICDQNERLTYSKLAEHEFFKNLDWTTIKNMPPPHVPVVTGRTDTSNFDDINTSTAMLGKSVTKKTNGFASANFLPFIGFTFTRSLKQQLDDDTIKNMNGFISQVNSLSAAGISATGNVPGSCDVEQITPTNTNNSSSVVDSLLGDKCATDIMISEHKSLTNELENAKRELEKVRKDLATSQNENSRIETDKQFYIQESEKLKARYKELSHKYDTAVEQSSKIDQQGKRLLSDLFSIFDCDRNFCLTDEANSCDIVEKIRGKYFELKKERDESTSMITDLTSQITMLNYRVELLTKNITDNEDRYNASCGELRETVAYLQTTLKKTTNESQSTISSLRQNAVECEHQLKALTEELEDLKASSISQKQPEQDNNLLGVLQSDLNTANSSVNLLTSENMNLNKKLNTSNELNLKQKNQIINFQSLIEALTNENKETDLEVNKLKSTINEKKLIITDLNNKISSLEKKQVDIMCQHELVSTKLKNKEQVQQELEYKISKLTDEVEKYKNSNNEESQQLLSQLKFANNRIDSLTVEIEDKTSSESFYKNSLLFSQAEVIKLTEEVKKLETANSSLDKTLTKLNDTIHTQKVSNYSLTELTEKLKDDITSANNETRQISNDFEEFKARTHEDHIRLTETLKQQEKLIEFLQKMNYKTKKTFKSDSRDDFYHGSFDVTSKPKRERTTRLNKLRTTVSKNKQSTDSKETKESFDKSNDSRRNSVSKDAPSTIQSSRTIISTVSNMSQSTNENNLVSFEANLDNVVASSPQSTSKPVSTFTSTTAAESCAPLSNMDDNNDDVVRKDSHERRMAQSNQSSEGSVLGKRWSSVEQQLPIAAKYSVLGGESSAGTSEQVCSSIHSASDETIVGDTNRHLFIERLNLCNIICMVCYNLIQFGTLFNVCKMCFLRCHTDCCENVYVQCVHGGEYDWFCYIPTVRFCQNYFSFQYNYNIPVMGWVSMLTKIIKTKTEWEQLWMACTQNSISFFKQQKTIEDINNQSSAHDPDLFETFSFQPGEFSVHINMRTNETLSYAGTTDSRSYWYIKLNPQYNTISKKKGSQSSSLFISTSLQDKAYWVAVLSNFFNQYTPTNKTIRTNSQHVHFIESIDTKNLFNICYSLMLNNDISLLATSNELFIYNNSSHGNTTQKSCHLVKLNGFNFISGMTRVKDSAFIICGKTRLLIKIETKVLMNELKSKTPTTFDITKFTFSTLIRNCHMVKAGKCNGEYYVAVGIGARFILLKPSNGTQLMDITFNSFIKNIHFTSIGIIYQTDSVYVLNIKNEDTKNFFDPNDTTLSVQIFGQRSSYNYLLDVFTLKTKKNHEEFLFCYSELGIFVNRDGIRTRKDDLIWPDVPTQFHMIRKHLLCVCYYDRIDVYDLSDIPANSNEFEFRILFYHPLLFMKPQIPFMSAPQTMMEILVCTGWIYVEVRCIIDGRDLNQIRGRL